MFIAVVRFLVIVTVYRGRGGFGKELEEVVVELTKCLWRVAQRLDQVLKGQP